MTTRLVLAYWKTVADCLVEFFDFEEERAAAVVARFRAQVAEDDAGESRAYRDLIYHSEPIHIASDLVGREPKRDDTFYVKYKQLQDRHLKYAKRAPISTIELESLVPLLKRQEDTVSSELSFGAGEEAGQSHEQRISTRWLVPSGRVVSSSAQNGWTSNSNGRLSTDFGEVEAECTPNGRLNEPS